MTSTTISPAVLRDEKLTQRVLAAAIVCIEEHGLQKVSMDHIATESGISRATLYRRFNNRDGLLKTLIQQQAIPYTENTLRKITAATSLAERIQIGTFCAVQELPEFPILKQVFGAGVSEYSLHLLQPTYQQLVLSTLTPLLEIAQEKGELRSGLDIDEVSTWLLREFLALVSNKQKQDDSLLRYIHQFILPILIPDHITSPSNHQHETRTTDQKIAQLDHKINKLCELIEQSQTLS